ncbi:hypothetical protein GCM10022198_05020 [Klugiella xanthotipulae]
MDTGAFSVPAGEGSGSSPVPFAVPAEDNFEDTSPHLTESGRSLSRREMRELWLAEQAKRDVAQPPAVPPVAPPDESVQRFTPVETHYPSPQPVSAPQTAVPTVDAVISPPPYVASDVPPANPVAVPVTPPAVTPIAQPPHAIDAQPVGAEPSSSPIEYVQQPASLPAEAVLPAVEDMPAIVPAAPLVEPIYVQPAPATDMPVIEPHPEPVAPVPEATFSEAPLEAEFVTDSIPLGTSDAPEVNVTAEFASVAEAAPTTSPYQFPSIDPESPEDQVTVDPSTVTFDAGDLPAELPTVSVVEASETPMASGTSPVEGSGGGDFDDIISRAVADEGIETSSGALILPVIPDSSDLAGALNETGEVYITGSIELPRALGETGGHGRLHDSVDNLDNVLGDMESDELAPDDTRPVAATRAISAQASGNAIVTPSTKSGNRLPLILSLTGGGFILLVLGLLGYGASNGLFG